MAEEVQWTRQQQANTLAAIDIVRELLAGGVKRGPINATLEVAKHARTADDLADGVSGLGNLAAMLAEHFATATSVSPDDVLRNAEEAVRTVKLID